MEKEELIEKEELVEEKEEYKVEEKEELVDEKEDYKVDWIFRRCERSGSFYEPAAAGILRKWGCIKCTHS
jgi:hypothetical protein